MVWAYAKAEVSHPGLFEKTADHIISLDTLQDFNSQHIAIIVWAFAKAKISHPHLYQKMANHIVELAGLRPAELI